MSDVKETTIFDLGFLKANRHVFDDDEYISLAILGKDAGSFTRNDYGDLFNGKCSCGNGFLINFTFDGQVRDENLDVIPDDKLAAAFHCPLHGGAARNKPDPIILPSWAPIELMREVLLKNIEILKICKAKDDAKMGYKPVKIEWDD
jgi:hypothetical protein